MPESAGSEIVDELEAEDGWFLERGAFAPEGKDVAFRVIERGRSRIGIWADGESRLITPKRIEAHDFGWMPDAKHLLVSISKDAESDELDLVDLWGRSVRKIHLSRPLRLRAGIAVSPDGLTAIASAQPAGLLEEPADLVRIELTTGEVTFVTRTAKLSEEYPYFLTAQHVIATTGALVADAARPSGHVVLLDLNSNRVRQLTPRDHVVAFASVSSTGRIIYDGYEADRDEGAAIWELRDPDARPEILTALTGHFPSINPTGDLLLLLRPGTPTRPEGLIAIDLSAG